jgi:hypothetical protein
VGIRDRAPKLFEELRTAGWLVDVEAARLNRVTEAAVRDVGRRRTPERGSLERDLLILDPRTRNAALPASLTGDDFDLMLPSPEGRVVAVRVRPELPPESTGVARLRFEWAGDERTLVVRVHDGLYNRGLALRGVNKLLASAGAPWRYHEILVGAIPLVVLAEPDGAALRGLLALDWVEQMPPKGVVSPASERALARAAELQELGVLHPGLGDDLVRRSFSGPRRFLDDLGDDLLGNHVAVLDGLSVLHLDVFRTFDSDRHEDFANGLFSVGGPVFAGAVVTDLDSTPTEEGPTEIDFELGDSEYRITFDQEAGVLELRIAHALNELLERLDADGRFHALAPVTHLAQGDPRAALLLTFLTEEQALQLKDRRLVRFAEQSIDPRSLSAEERLVVEEI